MSRIGGGSAEREPGGIARNEEQNQNRKQQRKTGGGVFRCPGVLVFGCSGSAQN